MVPELGCGGLGQRLSSRRIGGASDGADMARLSGGGFRFWDVFDTAGNRTDLDLCFVD